MLYLKRFEVVNNNLVQIKDENLNTITIDKDKGEIVCIKNKSGVLVKPTDSYSLAVINYVSVIL